MPAEHLKFTLPEDRIPTHWINLQPGPPGVPLPPLNPGTMQPAGPEDLTPIFPMSLIAQEVSAEPEVEIPEPVREALKLWRPTPLHRARRLERELDTPARIYYKYEGVSPAGSHKPNSAVAQAYANKEAGIERLVTETGAGQWGSALALASSLFGLECLVYMVGASYDQKPYRRAMMEAWGASVIRSPSDTTESGRGQAAHTTGSLGIAISEAVEVAAGDAGTNYALCSVPNHVWLHQTGIGQEAIAQMGMAGGEAKTPCLAAGPRACPTLTAGAYRYDFGDTVGMTPLLPMYTLGHDFVPPPVHAGGLRYHGNAPSLCSLVNSGLVEATPIAQNPAFEAAVRFAAAEGIIPGPEPAHAIRAVFDEAEAAREADEERVILFNLSGHGHFDMSAYAAYHAGELEDLEFSEADMQAALARLPEAPAIA